MLYTLAQTTAPVVIVPGEGGWTPANTYLLIAATLALLSPIIWALITAHQARIAAVRAMADAAIAKATSGANTNALNRLDMQTTSHDAQLTDVAKAAGAAGARADAAMSMAQAKTPPIPTVGGH